MEGVYRLFRSSVVCNHLTPPYPITPLLPYLHYATRDHAAPSLSVSNLGVPLASVFGVRRRSTVFHSLPPPRSSSCATACLSTSMFVVSRPWIDTDTHHITSLARSLFPTTLRSILSHLAPCHSNIDARPRPTHSAVVHPSTRSLCRSSLAACT